MKNTFTLLFILWQSLTMVFAQNLVPNPSFDIQDSCPAVSELFVCPPWDAPTLGSPDAFNDTCPTQNPAGRSGMGSAGVYLFNDFTDNREYMQAPLSSPLTGGQNYNVSFWVKRSNYRYASNRIGAYFSAGAVSNMTSTSVLPFTPQIENPPSNMLSATGWILIAGSFVASGGEDHITIGSFSTDAQTDTMVVNSSNTSKVSYYRVDDVSVTAIASGSGERQAEGEKFLIYPNPSEGKFYVANGTAGAEIKVFNAIGMQVRDFILSGDNGELDFTLLPGGIYYLRYTHQGKTFSEKIVKRQ